METTGVPDSAFASQDAARTVSLSEAFWTWCRVAALSFGGPAGQIAVMHRVLVDEKKWISEGHFLHALNFCMLLPGPEAQQLATYIGWLMHRLPGGLLAGILFILPGSVAILILSVLYAAYHDTLFVTALFFGLKPAVMAIVMEAVLRIGKRVLKNSVLRALALASFGAIFFLGVPFPVLIAVSALVGFLGGRIAPQWFLVLKPHTTSAKEKGTVAGIPLVDIPLPTWRRAVLISAICLPLWFGPLLWLRWTLGPDSVFVQEGLFFSQAAVVTFGGAYAVLAYLAQQAVEHYGWLQPGEMLDGLGMAETTPGPLIMVVQFVGFLGAWRNPGSLSPLAAGIAGSILTTWVTFVPCFYWIFLGAPSVERLRNNHNLTAALTAITAAVVGVIANLATWFTLHTLFQQVHTWRILFLNVSVPEWSSLNIAQGLIGILAVALVFLFRLGMVWTLVLCCTAGILFQLIRAGFLE